MHLIRKLYLRAAQLDFSVSFKHICGSFNPVADAISRFQVSRFRELAPEADQLATPVPAEATKLLGEVVPSQWKN